MPSLNVDGALKLMDLELSPGKIFPWEPGCIHTVTNPELPGLRPRAGASAGCAQAWPVWPRVPLLLFLAL